jgi:alginate O-acetyltransferase complex protein AlgI
MLFNSIIFFIFLPIVFLVYWNIGKIRNQNFFLLIASYVFYGWWDWRFLSLIIFSSLVDFVVGSQLGKREKPKIRKLLLFTSILVNIGFLGFFKYFNFFIDSFITAFSSVGIELSSRSLNVILPVGISFYTFQTLSYSIDIYRRKIKPTKDLIAFFTFVSFFPQLVAGPIERAANLLPQFSKKRVFNYQEALKGSSLIIWGFFKKVVVADNCAIGVNDIFDNYSTIDSYSLMLGVVLFAFQIYGDFSGYSDIAIGTARLFNIKLMRNFALPYFSRDIAEFWRRWHISLSTWFRDYVYIPLGGSKVSRSKNIRNIFVIFIVSGFWHGANWTFIIWGVLNAIYFLPLLLLKSNRKNLDIVADKSVFPSLREVSQMIFTFVLTCIAWVFFRSESVYSALIYLKRLFSFQGQFSSNNYLPCIVFILILLMFEWSGRKKEHPISFNFNTRFSSWLFYFAFITFIFYFGNNGANSFIYFQF